MLWLHPSLQLFATLIGMYAAYLGLARFQSQHLGKSVQFQWKRHVTFGRIAILLWMVGLAGGLLVARFKWNVNFVTGLHYKTAFTMFPLMVFCAASGIYMDKKKAKRTILPILHGIGNLILLGLALFQIRTGWQVIQDFIL